MEESARKTYVPSYALYGEKLAFPDVLHVETILDRAPDYEWVIAPHRHSQLHQVFFIESGLAKLSLDGQYFDLEGPFILNIPRNVIHDFQFSPGTSGWVLTVPTHELSEIYEDVRLDLGRALIARPDSGLADLFHSIHREFSQVGAARAIMLHALAMQIFCRIQRLEPETGTIATRQDSIFEAFRALVHRHHSDRWQIAQYAEALRISRTHLHRVCNAATGLSALAYVEDQSVQEACSQLAYTKKGIALIGYDLGYEDPAYFSRVFRRKVGLSPKEYRERLNQ